jgi:co-chaperonin GroES (HSP10)
MQIFKPSSHPPIHDFDVILVLRDEEKQTVGESLIVVPDRAKELASTGEVRAVSDNSSYVVGEKVVFTKYAGGDLELNGVTYTLLKEKEIAGRIKEVNVGETAKEREEKLQKALAQFEATGRG